MLSYFFLKMVHDTGLYIDGPRSSPNTWAIVGRSRSSWSRVHPPSRPLARLQCRCCRWSHGTSQQVSPTEKFTIRDVINNPFYLCPFIDRVLAISVDRGGWEKNISSTTTPKLPDRSSGRCLLSITTNGTAATSIITEAAGNRLRRIWGPRGSLTTDPIITSSTRLHQATKRTMRQTQRIRKTSIVSPLFTQSITSFSWSVPFGGLVTSSILTTIKRAQTSIWNRRSSSWATFTRSSISELVTGPLPTNRPSSGSMR